MSECDENEISKFRLEVRRPQEGKTVLCINHIIQDISNCIHLVLTMNTIASSLQFLGRMQEIIGGDRIVILNSKKKSSGGCHYAKDIGVVTNLIGKTLSGEKNIKVIVACSNCKRFNESLPDLLFWAADSIGMAAKKVKFVIHIDEAHKYIPENIDKIRSFNDSHCVSEIIGYTATPFGIWSNNISDPLFYNIFICDIDRESEDINEPKYFGVGSCEPIPHDHLKEGDLVRRFANITDPEIPIPEILIPESVKRHFNTTKMKRYSWLHKTRSFDCGDELTFLSFIDYKLPTLSISRESFSYNFIPSYTRKATHYQTMELIHNYYPTSNVIVINGDGIQLFRLYEGSGDEEGEMVSRCINSSILVNEYVNRIENKEEQKIMAKSLLEPSFMIEYLIKDTREFPTFVTGFQSVGMSVTLINESLGNFDNVIMAHQHISRDKIYQLCRFLFNYKRWSQENIMKIKRTKFHTLTESVTDVCLEYEENTRRLYMECGGTSRTLRQAKGLDPIEPTEKEIKASFLNSLKLKNPEEKKWKKFKVYDGNDEEEWEKAIRFYEGFRGKKITKKSTLEKIDGYYYCSDSKGRGLKTITDITAFEKDKWSSRFQLSKKQLKYARLFVGYDSVDDPSEYTIFVKYIELDDSPENVEILKKYCEKTKKVVKSMGDEEDRSDSGSESDL